MSMTRRQMMLAGLGLLVTGCTTPSTSTSRRPGADWPSDISSPRPSQGQSVDAGSSRATSGPSQASSASPTPGAGSDGPLEAISRDRWASRGPVPGRVNRMGEINRITVHHEGWTPVNFTDFTRTAQRIEHDRHVHVDHRGWGDIGYHYIIDRQGRLWEGRSLAYQGAHVGGHNEHNIGIMCLGNFDQQQPTNRQVDALVDTLRKLRRSYDIPVSRIYTHQELSPSACPGTNLQPRMVRIRRGSYLG